MNSQKEIEQNKTKNASEKKSSTPRANPSAIRTGTGLMVWIISYVLYY